MWQFFSHIWWFSYFFLIFDDSILTLCNPNIICDSSFLTFGGSLTFFSHLTVPSLHYGAPTLYVTVFFPCFVVHLLFLLILDDSILTLCNSNITYDSSFVTLGGFLTFFSYLTVSSSHYAVPTSHVIVLFSHLVVPLFFLTFDGFILTLCGFNITYNSSFVTLGGSLTFFLTLDGSIFILCSSNIIRDSSFLTFSGSLTFFSYLTVSSSHCAIPILHVIVFFSDLVIPLLFSHI